MDVHHHSHTARKKWTHYFWEFLMLFLAVFCGFLAEYQLEHKIEREKGKQYVSSFYEDLKVDTSTLTGIIKEYKRKVEVLNGASVCFDSLETQKELFDPCIANLVWYSDGFPDFVYADRTLTQLKNAGGLRLLKQADADSVLVYDKMLRNFSLQEQTGFQGIQNRVRDAIVPLLNYKNLRLKKADPLVPFLFTANPEFINRYFVLIEGYKNSCVNNIEKLSQLKEKANSLIEYFKKKYHLK